MRIIRCSLGLRKVPTPLTRFIRQLARARVRKSPRRRLNNLCQASDRYLGLRDE